MRSRPKMGDRETVRTPGTVTDRRAPLVALAALCWLPIALAACGPADRGSREDAGPDAAIVLETQGSFAFGGTVVTGDDGDTYHGDHGYVQFQIPRNTRQYPLVMWHGGGQFSKTYETTPDGRDGYQNIFLRKGFATYIIDQPGRGRAGRSTVAATIPEAEPSESNLFTIFRLGIWTPPDPPMFFPGVQFPQDPDAIDQYFRQVTPDTGAPGGGVSGVGHGATVATDAVATLLDRIGPAILITHSASRTPRAVRRAGSLPLRVRTSRPSLLTSQRCFSCLKTSQRLPLVLRLPFPCRCVSSRS